METQRIKTEILPENYRFLQQHVYSQVGIVLEDNKHYHFESRLAPIVKQIGLDSTNDLCTLLYARRNADLAHLVAEAMTTNETYFFRDPSQYEAIRTVWLPKLREDRKTTRALRFWSASASTGQVCDALGELANVIGGNLKCGMSTGVRLSMPTVLDGRDYDVRMDRSEVRERIAFECSEGYFWVTLLEAA